MAHLPPGTFHPTSKELMPTSCTPDLRSESEIMRQLLSHRPVTHEKNVWAFWDKGWAAMRPWLQRNVVDWVRRLGPEWEVRVLDSVPGSPHNIARFVDADVLPATFTRMDGPHSGQHSSDIVRVALLYLHGGAWLDVGGILTRPVDDLWQKVVSPENPIEVVAIGNVVIGGQSMQDRVITNTFLLARRGSQFMGLWHKVFAEVMKDRTNSHGIRNHPLFAHLSPFVLPDWLPFDITAEQAGDYVGHFTAAGRLVALVDPGLDWDGPRFFAERVMLLPLEEIFTHNLLTEYEGARQLAHLSLARSEPVDRADPQQAASEAFVETTLSRSTLVKMSQGLMPHPVQLATLWDRLENRGADVAPGTWAEYFRWASVHLDQTRELVPLSKEEMHELCPKRVWTAGVLDIIDSETPVRDWS